MTLVIPPGFGSAAFVLEGGVGTQPFITTLGVDLTDAGGDYVLAADTLFSAYAAAFIESTSNVLTLARVILSVGQDGGDQPTVESSLPPAAGEASGDFAPLSVAMLLNKKTSFLGRKGRGRMFIPGVIKDNMVDISGRVGTSTIDAFEPILDLFLAALADPGVEGIPSLPAVLLHSTATPPPTPIDSLTVNGVVGTMARRIK
jgi:hypothetical protein